MTVEFGGLIGPPERKEPVGSSLDFLFLWEGVKLSWLLKFSVTNKLETKVVITSVFMNIL